MAGYLINVFKRNTFIPPSESRDVPVSYNVKTGETKVSL